MDCKNRFGIWMQQIRAPFLVLSLVLVLIGISVAYRYGFFRWDHSLLLLLGVLMAHISVNLFNEISDHKTGIDLNTAKTPFSGGSGILQSGKTTVKAVTFVAYATLIAAALVGFYFCFTSGWLILVFMISGGLAIRFYTSHLAKWLLGEAFSGITLGTFVVLGTYYALTKHLNGDIILVSIPPGILTALLLFLNEFPDAEADKKGGRYHLIIHFGKKKSSFIYLWGMVLNYSIILIAPFLGMAIPFTVYFALLTMPLALKAFLIVLNNPHKLSKLIPALGMNVGVVIFTDLLLALGFFWGNIKLF